MRVDFQVAGEIGEHKSVQFGAEMARNVYLSRSETSGQTGCHDFPGLKNITDGSGADRGHHVMGGTLYLINGQTLFSESANGSRVSLGTITGTDRAIFADDGANLYITANKLLYKYNGITISTISQTVITNPSSILYINNQFLLEGDGNKFAVSDVSDGDTYNALAFGNAQTQPDNLVRCYYYNQQAYLFCELTTELWYNTGTGNLRFARKDTALVNVGIAGKHAVTNTDQYLYWLGDDSKFYQCVGSSSRRINTSGVSHIVEGFSVISDCVASSFVFEGQDFVLFKFPSEGAALLYSETNNYWVELSSGTDMQRGSWYGNSVIRAYGKNISVDHRNGNSYELDPDTYTDNGDARLRIVELPSFTGKNIGANNRRIQCSGIKLNMQVGVGLATGQGVAPVLMCELSNDGGHTWDSEQHVPFGALGDYTKEVSFDAFSNGYKIKARISVSDPVYVSMFDGSIEIREAGY